jgi:hypothetical protein
MDIRRKRSNLVQAQLPSEALLAIRSAKDPVIDLNKLKDVLNSAASFTRRVHQELTSVANSGGTIDGSNFRIVGNVIYKDGFIDELNELEEITYDAVRKSELISKKGAEALLHKAISSAVLIEGKSVRLHDFEKALVDSIAELKKGLQEPPSDWSYLIRVTGFDPKCLPETVGRVRFSLMNDSELSAFEKDIRHETIRELIRKRYIGEIGARVTPKAVDDEAALELALREVRKTLDVINFFANSSYPPIFGVHLPWEGHGTQEQFVGIQSGKGMVAHGRLQGAAVKVDLRQFNQTDAFTRATELLAKELLNPFEKRLVSALQWAGRASFQDRIDQAFLFYAISLENLLLGTKSEVELSYRLSIYGAHLLGKDQKNRNKIHQNLKKLYRLRSVLVHAGSAPVRDIELAMIRSYARYAIALVLVSEPFSKMLTEEDLNDYFQAKVLGLSANES